VALDVGRTSGPLVPGSSGRSGSGSRHPVDGRRGTQRDAALVAQVQSLEDAQIRLETELELFRRERQRDQARLAADGSHDAHGGADASPGNGRAGAA